ncbi:PAS domain-containing protein [Alteromonas sp. ASW11-130]|uniref:PAS domain-containing protein n=1 Tax=Alteromonas sp. ASW11-130 TaxID=3015775 RepID=UPI0022429C1B|nr:PAS domain-containing protein [Alteromonas sp. ASW11-130]MCW8093081.1 PAS domain-containing protein [Alteromonas sp. ASW11-130]
MTIETPHFLAGGGAMGARLRAFAWEQTPLGAPTVWPSSLKTLVGIMLASNQPMFVAWGATRTLIYNDYYAEILGNKHPNALGRDFLEVWYEIREQLQPIVSSALRGEPVQMQDIPLMVQRHGYPEQTHFSFFYSPVRGEGLEIEGLFCACTEITAQVLTEQRLAESEARHRGVLANMDEAFLLLGPDFCVLEANDAASRLLKAEGDMVGEEFGALFSEGEQASVYSMCRRVSASGTSERHDYSHVSAEQGLCWFEARAYMVDAGLAVFIRDISEHKKMAADAADAAERVQLALDAGAIVGTWVWTIPDNRFIADARFAASFGLDETLCKSGLPLELVMESVYADDRDRVAAAIEEVMGRGGAYKCEYRVWHRDGTLRWVEANGQVELDPDGKAVRFPGVLLDIEDRRRMEAERDQADMLLRMFTDAVPGVVYAKDRAGRFMVANRGVAELLGLPPEAFLGRTDEDVLADRVQSAAIMATDRRIMDSGVGEQIEEEVMLSDGTPAIWLSSKAPWRDKDGNILGLIGSSVDITDRKRMENELRVSEKRFALAMDVAQFGTWVWDVQTGDVRMDPRCRQIVGAAPDDAVVTLDVLSQSVHPVDWPRIEAALDHALQPGSGGGYSEEFRWIHADGQVVWTMARGQVLFEGDVPDARALSMIGTVLDVTERRRMVESLEQADRRKDEFLAMLAHELRNPLAPIGTAASLLEMAPVDNETHVREIGGVITRQVAHMTELVDDLLDVSRVTRGLVEFAREPVDVRSVIDAAVEQAQPLIAARGHTLTTQFHDTALVIGDHHRLVQVVTNLLNNAAKYTPTNGRLQLSMQVENEKVQVRVTDNGIGMDEALLPMVFELFAQGKRTPDRSQGGLGIGLALVHSIVEQHGGTVAATSPGLNLGSTFTMTLPLAATDEALVQTPSVTTRASAALKILVVDDNRDAAELLAILLGAQGHDAEIAVDGAGAVAMVRADPRWDAFVLDIGLPDMTGYELAQQLKMAADCSTYIALTGYDQSSDRQKSKAAGFDHHLAKPADFGQLQKILNGIDAVKLEN